MKQVEEINFQTMFVDPTPNPKEEISGRTYASFQKRMSVGYRLS